MLNNTFLHFKNINRQTEAELWESGVRTWEEYAKKESKQLYLAECFEAPSEVELSRLAFEKQDIDFFVNNIPHIEYYRIALSYPEQVIFLDIETTGLSIYYNYITIVGWSIDNKYNVLINGNDADIFYSNMKHAKIIVTFNGTLFDIKFIKKYFPGITIPPLHIDLRFFAKRVGMTGGQKAIEDNIDIKRENKIADILGEAAPVLWHQYRRGDKESLKRLIEYNHADIEGMKAIFDACVALQYKKDKIPPSVQTKVRFKENVSKIQWANNSAPRLQDGLVLPPYAGSTKPLITYSELNTTGSLDLLCVAGIDLVSAEDRETGFCTLRGNRAETCRLKTDEELITAVIEAKAQLVSIDSPLSIPKGRTSFWDDDPMRKQFGITRECERILKRRGISSYPCLIQTMQKLTERGMLLTNKLRKLGIPVIESYPGAAQDIMNIPRKQAGLKYLTGGLSEFGLYGNFLTQPISHDELDAITSAIVGLFFWVGKFEGLGNTDEKYLIIPDVYADNTAWINRVVIGVSGLIGAGKSTVATWLENKKFTSIRLSDILRGVLQEEQMAMLFSASGDKIVVDGLRFPEERAALVEHFGPAFKHIHIDCDNTVKGARATTKAEEDIPLNKALQHDVESSIMELSHLAHCHISNNSRPEELFRHIDICIGENTCR